MRRHRTAALVLLLLLPLGGCASTPAAAPSLTTEATAAPTVAPTLPAASPTAAPRPVAVPTVKATLRPAPREQPEPTRFRAGDVDIDLPVEPYGVDDAGLMQLPETVDEVAWYAYSARPGDGRGSTVLAAHVDTVADGLGPFARLRELDKGEELSVTDASDRTRRYVVTGVEKVAKTEVPLDRVFAREGDPELKIITCGGSFDRGHGYSDNVIVTARPVG